MTISSAESSRKFEVNTTYEPYSNDPDYIAGNREFIRSLDLAKSRRVLDLACGVGTLTTLMWETRPDLTVIGIDLSHATLLIAEERLCVAPNDTGRSEAHGEAGVTNESRPRLAAASADAIPLAESSVDAVIMGHSIHMLTDANKLLAEISRVSKPGALFAFNTSFYAGTFVPGTESIYHDWVKESLAFIQRRDKELRGKGLPGIKRQRGRVPPAFTNTWPSAREWGERLERHGFRTRRVFERSVKLTQYSFETIGAYAGFANVMLSGYPTDVACEALQEAAEPTFAAAELDSVPRNWLEYVAEKV